MKLLEKPDLYSPAFEIIGCAPVGVAETCSSCGQPVTASSPHRAPRLLVKSGVEHDDDTLPEEVDLSGIAPGSDYSVVRDEGVKLLALRGRHAEALGGFHVATDGTPLPHSIWDLNFRPKAPSPYGMALVAGVEWWDIYPLNTDPCTYGTSAPNVELARGGTFPTLTPFVRSRKFNFYGAQEILALHAKRMPTRAAFAIAAAGVEEGKRAGQCPEKTGHIPGLRSSWGCEMMTGVLWNYGSDIDEDGWVRLLGGSWDFSGSGPRASDFVDAVGAYGSFGARGCCDHLILG